MSIPLTFVKIPFLIFSLYMLPGGFNGKKPDLNRSPGMSRDTAVQNQPVVFDHFEFTEGVEVADLKGVRDSYRRRRVIQLCDSTRKGRAEDYFFEESAKYDIKLYYVDGTGGRSEVDLAVNGRPVGNIVFGSSNSFKEKTIHDVNVQKWSKITLEFKADGDEKCRVVKLVFTSVGKFDTKACALAKPRVYRVFETAQEQAEGRRVFSEFVRTATDSMKETRKSELAGLGTVAEWKARQKKIRENIDLIFGEFPERTPLNASVTGKLEREKYTIEKVIFESQPKYFVTANLYLPVGRRYPLPGVLFTCGHSTEGKAAILYHETCLGLVLKGYVVLAFDPMGQGERSEYFDAGTKKPLVELTVSQHLYAGRPAFLVDWTLSGLRTWDGIRALDYLESRPEVNKDQLAVVGNSGGGQMALLIAAADERIKVCAAAHPGGECENSYLHGQDYFDREILSLIPPRPLRIIVGRDSGEEPSHRKKVEDMQLFYEGLGYKKDRIELTLVDGVHNMEQPKREAAYEWLNKWFDKEEEGKAEAILHPEKQESLQCTESGNTIISLKSETAQTLNVKRADLIYKPATDLTTLKERIALRTGLTVPPLNQPLKVHSSGHFLCEGISVEKLTYESEKGIIIPSLLLIPPDVKPGSPVFIYASDKGKPGRFDGTALPFQLVSGGCIVLAIDVRGIGETSPTPPYWLNQYSGYTPTLWQNDVPAIQSSGFGRTTLGMRTLDVIRGIDFITSRNDLKGRKIVTAGEGTGGLWALLASIYDPRVDGVVTTGTLPSYRLLITSQYYNVWGYFYVPGALRDFDIPDLARLVPPKPQVWISPVNALGEKLGFTEANSLIGSHQKLQIITSDKMESKDFLQTFIHVFH